MGPPGCQLWDHLLGSARLCGSSDPERSDRLSYREVSVVEVREVLRAWLSGAGARPAAERGGVNVKTARRYIEAAVAAGLVRDGGEGQLSEELLGVVLGAVRPARPDGHGDSWELLVPLQEQISKRVKAGLTVTRIGELLTREGTDVPYRTLHRYAVERCGFTGGRAGVTVRVDDGEPGGELQVDFGDLGMIPDQGRRRLLRALVFTAVFSRYCFVYLTFSQTVEEVIAGCEEAWIFFGGVFKILVPDNLKPVVTTADAVNPVWNRSWLEYSQARGFYTDPARVRSPQDKPRVAYCTSSGRFVRSSRWGWSGVLRRAAGLGAVGRVAGVGRVVEDFAFIVIPLPCDNSGVVPVFDGCGGRAEQGGHLAERDQAGVEEPLAAAG
jgi:transposase